jgi:hypothetical protein
MSLQSLIVIKHIAENFSKLATEEPGCDELFVHNLRFPFTEADRPRLCFVYNLNMEKQSVRGRDRLQVGLPEGWTAALTNLIKSGGTELLEKLETQQQKPEAHSFYELRNALVIKYLNSYGNQRARERKLQEEDRRYILRDLAKAQEVNKSMTIDWRIP